MATNSGKQILIQRKHEKKDIETYQKVLNSNDFKGMALLLTVMTFSGSTAVCERGFSCMDSQQKDFHTRLPEKNIKRYYAFIN